MPAPARPTIRLDVSYGDGIYKSTDAGRTWRHVGLRDSKHIGRICIHPHESRLVYVAALGDIFGPNEERGVFRTRDGGQSWEKVLYRNADTGAIDISMDPDNPPHPVRRLLADAPQFLEHFESADPAAACSVPPTAATPGRSLPQSRPSRRPARQDRRLGIARPLRPRLGAGRGTRGREDRPLPLRRLRRALEAGLRRTAT